MVGASGPNNRILEEMLSQWYGRRALITAFSMQCLISGLRVTALHPRLERTAGPTGPAVRSSLGLVALWFRGSLRRKLTLPPPNPNLIFETLIPTEDMLSQWYGRWALITAFSRICLVSGTLATQ